MTLTTQSAAGRTLVLVVRFEAERRACEGGRRDALAEGLLADFRPGRPACLFCVPVDPLKCCFASTAGDRPMWCLRAARAHDSILAMRAAITRGRGVMDVADVAEPREPGPGEVRVRPEAVGICGSDFHYFLGDLGTVDAASLYPRILGHEVSAIVDQ